MSNQWGRNTQVARSGSSGFLLAAILCVVLIGAGVYGWLVRQTLHAEIAALTESNTALSDKLAASETSQKKITDEMNSQKRNSGEWAGKLEQDYADLQLNEVPKLNRLLDKRDATISKLEKDVNALKSQALRLSEEKTAAEEALKTLREGAAADTADASDLQAHTEALNAELERLRAEKSDLESARAGTQSLLLAAQADATAAKSTLTTLQNQKIPGLERELATEKAKNQALEQKLALTKPTATDQAPPVTASGGPGRTPRDDAEVATLVNGLPGLGGLDESERRKLQDQLASGACVTEALETVFDKVPLIVMRNLMRELKSDC